MSDFTPMDYFWSYSTLPGVRTAVVAFVLLLWAVARRIRSRAGSYIRGASWERPPAVPRTAVLRATAGLAALCWVGKDLLPLLSFSDEGWSPWFPALGSGAQLLFGALPLAVVLVGLLVAQFIGNGSHSASAGPRQFPTARRGWRSELSGGELRVVSCLALLLLLLAVWSGVGSERGEDGWITQRTISGSKFASTSVWTFGWSFGVPMVLLMLAMTGTAVLLLRRTNLPPFPSDAGDRARDTRSRRSVSGTTVRMLGGALLLSNAWALSVIGIEARTKMSMGTRIDGALVEFRWTSDIAGLADPLLATAYLCGVCGAVLLLAVAFGWTPRMRSEAGRTSRQRIESNALVEEAR